MTVAKLRWNWAPEVALDFYRAISIRQQGSLLYVLCGEGPWGLFSDFRCLHRTSIAAEQPPDDHGDRVTAILRGTIESTRVDKPAPPCSNGPSTFWLLLRSLSACGENLEVSPPLLLNTERSHTRSRWRRGIIASMR